MSSENHGAAPAPTVASSERLPTSSAGAVRSRSPKQLGPEVRADVGPQRRAHVLEEAIHLLVGQRPLRAAEREREREALAPLAHLLPVVLVERPHVRQQ